MYPFPRRYRLLTLPYVALNVLHYARVARTYPASGSTATAVGSVLATM